MAGSLGGRVSQSWVALQLHKRIRAWGYCYAKPRRPFRKKIEVSGGIA